VIQSPRTIPLAQGAPIFTITGGVPKTLPFVNWRIGGVDQPPGQRTITFTVQGNTTAEAVYPPRAPTYLILK
jgi:hypothetical protein